MIRLFFMGLLLSLISTGCMHSSGETWENFKTAGRYMQKGVDAMWGKEYESRMLTSDEEFIGPNEDEFIPLKDADLKNPYLTSDAPIAQPKGVPGKRGVPLLDAFYLPPDTLAAILHPVHFATDEHVVKEQREVRGLLELASYLKKNPKTFLMVEGNCDERASASYNLALGMRRANYVRSFLVKHGVDLNRIYTVSKGKENPLALGHTPEDWKLNRRCEFRIYEK